MKQIVVKYVIRSLWRYAADKLLQWRKARRDRASEARIHVIRKGMLPVALCAILAAQGCMSSPRREWERFWRRNRVEQPAPDPAPAPVPDPDPGPAPVPDPVPDPVPVPVPPAPDPDVVADSVWMQWFERDGRIILRIRDWLRPLGYAVITGHGHKSLDPHDPTHEQWMNANNHRRPHRHVDGWAEWTLPWSGAEFADRATAHRMKSGAVVMVFVKTDGRPPDADTSDVSWFIHPRKIYGLPGAPDGVRNRTNTEYWFEL
jgi:hypothetical protein